MLLANRHTIESLTDGEKEWLADTPSILAIYVTPPKICTLSESSNLFFETRK